MDNKSPQGGDTLLSADLMLGDILPDRIPASHDISNYILSKRIEVNIETKGSYEKLL
ncbi:MAG: hypothetical protein WAX69_27330 [Victivallales bacterium]